MQAARVHSLQGDDVIDMHVFTCGAPLACLDIDFLYGFPISPCRRGDANRSPPQGVSVHTLAYVALVPLPEASPDQTGSLASMSQSLLGIGFLPFAGAL